MNYPLKSVQVLRGFAAIAVLLYHAGIYSNMYFESSVFTFGIGTLGVDFFFTLSGFIITYVHLKDIEEKGSVRHFAIRRIIRIFPFYWFVLIVAIAFDPGAFPGWNLFFQNALLFRLPMSLMPLKVAWSLTFEMMFYLLFALSIWAGKKVASIMLAIWLLLIVFSPGLNNSFYEVLVSNLNIEFLFGCFAGYIVAKKKYSFNILFFIAGVILVASVFMICILWNGFNRFNIIFTTLMGATSGWIILHAALLDKKGWSHMFTFPVLMLAGDASYSIYLTHTVYMPYIFKGTKHLLDIPALSNLMQLIVIFLIITISIAGGIAIHKFIEKPMLLYLRKKIHLARTGTSLS
jgi:exopolysaccharide production protein ExoZ